MPAEFAKGCNYASKNLHINVHKALKNSITKHLLQSILTAKPETPFVSVGQQDRLECI